MSPCISALQANLRRPILAADYIIHLPFPSSTQQTCSIPQLTSFLGLTRGLDYSKQHGLGITNSGILFWKLECTCIVGVNII